MQDAVAVSCKIGCLKECHAIFIQVMLEIAPRIMEAFKKCVYFPFLCWLAWLLVERTSQPCYVTLKKTLNIGHTLPCVSGSGWDWVYRAKVEHLSWLLRKSEQVGMIVAKRAGTLYVCFCNCNHSGLRAHSLTCYSTTDIWHPYFDNNAALALLLTRISGPFGSEILALSGLGST